MVQLDILTGKKAGQAVMARLFPFQVGRAASAHLPLEEDGVWEQHLEITRQRGVGFFLRAFPQALVAVNGQGVEETVLHNGDLIELGSVQLRFWLAPVRQRSLFLRESLVWLLLAALFAAEVGLIYWLLA